MTPRDPRHPNHDPADLADDFARAVKEAYDEMVAPIAPEDQETGDTPSVQPPRRIPWVVGAVSAVLILIGVVAWRYKDGDDGRQPTTEVQPQPRGLVSPTPPPPAVQYEPRPIARVDTTAICTDSTASFSKHSSGTCSGHDGVLCWIHHPGRNPPTTAPFCTTSVQKP